MADATFDSWLEDARRLILATHELARSQRSSDHGLARSTHARLAQIIKSIADEVRTADEIDDPLVRRVVASSIERWRAKDN